MFKIVLFLSFYVLCVVHTQSDEGCKHSRSYTRVKRGKYYPGPPMRFYNRPPMTFPVKGPFSYTPPPFMQNDEPPYPGSRPYKVSKRPTNEGLADNDINNLVKHLSKQDLDKILEFAYEKDKYSEKSKDIDYDYSRPHKRENSQRPTYTKDFYKGSSTNYQQEKPYEVEFKKYINYVTEAAPVKYAPQDDRRNPYPVDTVPNQVQFYGPLEDGPTQFKEYTPQDERPTQFKTYAPQVDRPVEFKVYGPQDDQISPFKTYAPQADQRPPAPEVDDSLTSQSFANPTTNTYPGSNNTFFTDTAEEEKLPLPINMREEDFDVSYTNNVPTVVKADSSSYQVENFGDLPLMNYNSKLHSVSSYHVPHYTVTQSKSESLSPPAPSTSFSSSQTYSSSSTLLKPSPAAASIKAPPFEPAPPPSAAQEQSDAHLKAIKIWSHRSKGAAYTLHDDGTLTPERPRPPKYG